MGASLPWPARELAIRVERLLDKLEELMVLLEEERRALLDQREEALPELAQRTKALLRECEQAQNEIVPYRVLLAREPLDDLWREVQAAARNAQRLNEFNGLLLAIPPARGTIEAPAPAGRATRP